MGSEARAKKKVASEVRFITLSNGARGDILGVISQRGSESKDSQDAHYRAVAALSFSEEVTEMIDERNIELAELERLIKDETLKGDDLRALIKRRREINDLNKEWRKQTETLDLSVGTISKICEIYRKADVFGWGLKRSLPEIHLLEEAKAEKPPEKYTTPPPGFYAEEEAPKTNGSQTPEAPPALPPAPPTPETPPTA